jgi:hypothetical protein
MKKHSHKKLALISSTLSLILSLSILIELTFTWLAVSQINTGKGNYIKIRDDEISMMMKNTKVLYDGEDEYVMETPNITMYPDNVLEIAYTITNISSAALTIVPSFISYSLTYEHEYWMYNDSNTNDGGLTLTTPNQSAYTGPARFDELFWNTNQYYLQYTDSKIPNYVVSDGTSSVAYYINKLYFSRFIRPMFLPLNCAIYVDDVLLGSNSMSYYLSNSMPAYDFPASQDTVYVIRISVNENYYPVFTDAKFAPNNVELRNFNAFLFQKLFLYISFRSY